MLTNSVVSLLEWIPCDRSHIFDLNQRLGSFDRSQVHKQSRKKGRGKELMLCFHFEAIEAWEVEFDFFRMENILFLFWGRAC